MANLQSRVAHVMLQNITLTEEEPHITQQAEPQQSMTYFFLRDPWLQISHQSLTP
jgi:hypothetical protein